MLTRLSLSSGAIITWAMGVLCSWGLALDSWDIVAIFAFVLKDRRYSWTEPQVLDSLVKYSGM